MGLSPVCNFCCRLIFRAEKSNVCTPQSHLKARRILSYLRHGSSRALPSSPFSAASRGGTLIRDMSACPGQYVTYRLHSNSDGNPPLCDRGGQRCFWGVVGRSGRFKGARTYRRADRSACRRELWRFEVNRRRPARVSTGGLDIGCITGTLKRLACCCCVEETNANRQRISRERERTGRTTRKGRRWNETQT
jgi:hypothetical protein